MEKLENQKEAPEERIEEGTEEKPSGKRKLFRKNQIIIPGGNDTLEAGDNVIVVSMAQGLEDLKDILR